jgi:hypothetical protein
MVRVMIFVIYTIVICLIGVHVGEYSKSYEIYWEARNQQKITLIHEPFICFYQGLEVAPEE